MHVNASHWIFSMNDDEQQDISAKTKKFLATRRCLCSREYNARHSSEGVSLASVGDLYIPDWPAPSFLNPTQPVPNFRNPAHKLASGFRTGHLKIQSKGLGRQEQQPISQGLRIAPFRLSLIEEAPTALLGNYSTQSKENPGRSYNGNSPYAVPNIVHQPSASSPRTRISNQTI